MPFIEIFNKRKTNYFVVVLLTSINKSNTDELSDNLDSLGKIFLWWYDYRICFDIKCFSLYHIVAL